MNRSQLNIRDRHNAQGFTLRWSELGQKLEKFFSYKSIRTKEEALKMAKEEREKIVQRLKNYDDNAHYYAQHRAENKLANSKCREVNKEKMAGYLKKYREANKDKITENHRKYYSANKEKIQEQKRKYKKMKKISFNLILYLSNLDVLCSKEDSRKMMGD